ncbi:MAG: hypothetical protein HRT61_12745 [Ekhidna sp.]|nr:hypothetical protein [Ekhidna sp.]
MKKILLSITLACLLGSLYAQDRPVLLTDSTLTDEFEDAELFQEQSELDPQRAALLSAIFPGMGQVYNKQYWKVPLVWGGVLTFAHFINYNNRVYHGLRNAALLSTKGLPNPYASIVQSETALIRNRDNFRRNRDLLIIVGTAFYLLQIVDAHVSAHLDEFKVNDQLALGIEPSIQSTPLFSQALGVSFVLKF